MITAEQALTDRGAAKETVRHVALPPAHLWIGAAILCLAYFIGNKVGFALTFKPHPISVLWPPNAILLSALVLTAPRFWWLFIVAAFPAHLAAQIDGGVPTSQVLAWFISNCSEALIGAGCIRLLVSGPLRFDSFRHVSVFIIYGALLAPFVSSFIDVAFVTLIGWGQGSFWHLWRLRFFSNVVASVALVPVIVTWAALRRPALRTLSLRSYVEAGLLGLGLFAVSVAVFLEQQVVTMPAPALPYALTPFLIWAAVRLGPLGTSTSLLVIVVVAIWGAIHDHGPFIATSPLDSALAVQIFLIVVSIPVLLLAARTEETQRTAKSLRDEIAERERAEAALRRSEDRFSSAFRSTPAAMVITRRSDGQIVDVNGRWQTLFGFTRFEAVGCTLLHLGIFISAKDATKLVEHTGEPGRARDLEMRLRTRFGATLQAILTSEQIEMSGEPCYISIIRDVTQQRRAERDAQEQRRQMTHLTRVASLGELSGALAHELNQPLTAILSNAQAAQRYLSHEPVDLDGLREILEDIVSDDKRAAEVIKRLRALLKRGETQFLPLDVNEITEEALTLAHGDIVLRNVAVRTHLAPQLPMVRGDRVQLQQVLLNLIVNAADAMNSNDSMDRELDVTTTLDSAGDVQVSVRDRGYGIADDRLQKVFEPFYTTKADGLGIGLSISRSIIASHAGRLWAETNSDRGATFRFSIPVGEAPPR